MPYNETLPTTPTEQKIIDELNSKNRMKELESLPELELKVLAILHLLGGSWFGYGNCYWVHDAILDGEGNLTNMHKELGDRKGLSKLLKNLRDKGFVQYKRGLMTEDGEVAGAGNAPVAKYESELELICEKRGWL